MAWNEETWLTAPKTKFEFFDDFERQKHVQSNGPMHKAVPVSEKRDFLEKFKGAVSRVFSFHATYICRECERVNCKIGL